MQDDEPLSAETLELADTRPPMAWLPWLGAVPVTAAGLLFTGCGLTMALTGSWAGFAPFFPLWWGVGKLIALDYHALTRIDRWLATSAWSWDANAEGGASASPFPLADGPLVRAGIRRPILRGIP